MKKHLSLLIGLLSISLFAVAQEDTTITALDEIQVDVKKVSLVKDTAIIDLFVISDQKGEREFKLNTFASQIVDAKHNDHLYSSILFGRVFISIEDRQNYLHYVLPENAPVAVQIKVSNWKKEYGKPQAIRLVFEDSEEEGRFRELRVKL